jgi:hypothetical protein
VKEANRALKISRIIRDPRATAQECKKAAHEHPDEELTEYLQEISVMLRCIA